MSLVCEGLGAGYAKVQIVWDLSLSVEQGECVALVGKNGMGKTTLLKTIMGMTTRHGGTVKMFDEDISTARTHDIVRMGVSYAPQDDSVFEDLSVDQNIRLGALRSDDYAGARDRVLEAFPVLGKRLGQRVGTLSGGERKMLLVARALASEPRLLILDEVSEGLQPSMRDVLAAQLAAYRERTSAAIFIVEQNIQFALDVADRFAVLTGGRVVEQGDADPTAASRIERHMTL
jgi:branched-chain amino acid transport system ATP-binding protein